MPILGRLVKKGLQLRQAVEHPYQEPFQVQKEQLRQLLFTARHTRFGQHYHFEQLLRQFDALDGEAFYSAYRQAVPIHDYNKIQREWWHLSREGEKHICWPERVKYFALSSGTSEAASKYIPMTGDMLKAINKVSVRQILSLNQYDLPESLFQKGILMLGGSTALNRHKYSYEGDLSGITCKRMPYWFYSFYKPGHKISREKDWAKKLDEIMLNAPKWDIGVIVGVPAWLQMLLEKIIDHYGLKNIHEIWPNLRIFIHGGVSISPYLKSFERLTARPLTYIETYLASEGFIAFQTIPYAHSMQLMLNSGIFFEFIPFNEQNFNAEGEVRAEAETLMAHQVEVGKEYALLLSSCAGAWRYLLGDVVRFTDVADSQIVISGRTKHFLSLCGEHLSVDNMNRAIQMLSEELNVEINEYTVAGIRHDNLFAHHWYISVDEADISEAEVQEKLDAHLKYLNDDYRTERSAALKEVIVTLLPHDIFLQWMKAEGKEGGQHKFPRVLKGKALASWEAFLLNV